ncbi:unnamed protein product [Larinioides sclopetarius]|uniref:Cytochrome P450 n=2 Tax=Larinioides sclopetarius TaxID=280406 RepID=A0AAV2AHX1_9ARAC
MDWAWWTGSLAPNSPYLSSLALIKRVVYHDPVLFEMDLVSRLACAAAIKETPGVFAHVRQSVVRLCQDLLKCNKMSDKSWVYKWMEPALGKGIITCSGEKAKFLRRLLMPSFHTDAVRKHLKVFIEESETLVNVLKEETNKEFTNIENFITLCTIDIVLETMLGTKMDVLKNGNLLYKTALERAEDIFISRLYKPWLWPSFIFWNTTHGKEFKQYMNVLDEITKRVIQEKKEKHLREKSETRNGKYKALLDLLLAKHFETHELNEDDIREEVNTFILAGHQTVATSASWALFLIGLHPEVQAKIHEEIDEVFRDDMKRPLTEIDLKNLHYLDCVLKETDRLYPAIPLFARQATEDSNVCGYVIPKGTSCVVPLYFLNRNEDVFPEPNKFDPDRFLPENSSNIPEYGYIPFSAGARSCIGYKYAEMELKTIMCSILRNFTVKSLDDRDKIQPIMNIVLRPSQPIRLRIRSRSIQKHSQIFN